ncbi:hypothetical protein O181_074667 [Austropuccinia psidii MF-1]|uniref:Tet-like 2OG-Fe(II) oxygenase domain-containing protein n=1 Tax=Austropuccinia psidii MF-1 TaxID=1389203 RepID=A0A9Q3FBB5_9BASI|nr:hypothetical protein [Austropuccinia psidii MF-1]
MTLRSLSQNIQEIETNKQVLCGIIKGIGFRPGSNSGKSAGFYSRKPGSTPHQIETDNNQWTKLHQYAKFVYLRISDFSKLAANEDKSLMEAAKLLNFSQLEWTSANPKEEFKSFTNVIVTQNGFFNKPHQDLNYLNSWTYDIFSFVSKKDFHPLASVLTPSGLGFNFNELKMKIDFPKDPGIMEIILKTSTMLHQAANPPEDIINHDEITHVGFSFQINHKLFTLGNKFLKMTPTKINSKVNGSFVRNMQDQKRTKKYQL